MVTGLHIGANYARRCAQSKGEESGDIAAADLRVAFDLLGFTRWLRSFEHL